MLKKKLRKPKRSLRTLLIFWLLIFSVIPLVFITFYSISKFKSSARSEVNKRIELNFRELKSLLTSASERVRSIHARHIEDNSFIFYLANQEDKSIKELMEQWLVEDSLNEISLFSPLGEQLHKIVLSKNKSFGYVKFKTLKFLPESLIKSLDVKKTVYRLNLDTNNRVRFSVFSKIHTDQGAHLGYLKESIYISMNELAMLKDKSGIELIAFKPGYKPMIYSDESLATTSENFLLSYFESKKTFDLEIKGEPFSFEVQNMNWQNDQIKIALGVSSRSSELLLEQINKAFISMLLGIVFLLIVMSFIISRILLRPLTELAEVFMSKDPSEELIVLPKKSETELGLLTEGSNELFAQVFESQQELKENIFKLEAANTEIKGAQSKMVHTAKMAGLGQLVAGVAHELNNPIGFIHSNMGHLKEYSQNLIKIINSSDLDKEKLEKLKKDLEFDYITEDLPKLIKSCEDGARRTRDIVLSLRNFSRLEEAHKKEVDINKSLEDTLDLISSQIKHRVKVVKGYAKLPQVTCYPGELNQVFMNILTNAAQAIDGDGEIKIDTKYIEVKDSVEISVADNGCGISPENMEKLFDPFFTTKPQGVGTGLGLSISYGIIENHSGFITAESKLGEGSKFIITIPRKS